MLTPRPFLVGPVALVAIVGAACTPTEPLQPLPFEPAGETAAPDPSTYGPFPVGVRTMTFVDDSRAGPGGVGSRTLTTEVWYPADEAARGQPGANYVLYDSLPEDIRAKLAPTDLGTLETVAVRDAAPRPDRGPFPVVVFSHGKGGIRMQSTFYTVYLASHGYVVVSPDHQGDTVSELLEAGNVDVTSTVQSYSDRPLDVVFLLNSLDALDAADPLKPILDMEHLGVTGHSFGALTTMLSIGRDYGISVAVAQCPVGIGLVQPEIPVPLEEVGKAIMVQSSGADQILPEDIDASSLWDHMSAPRAWQSLKRGGHFTYSDLCIFDINAIDAALDIDASNVLGDGCGPDNVPPDIAFPLIRNGAIGFFNVHLRGSAASKKFLTQGTLDGLTPSESTIQE